MDRFGIYIETTFEARVDTAGRDVPPRLRRQMVLSHDTSCYIDWIDPNVMAMMPQWHYLHIEHEVLPYLREHGVTDEQINTMLVDNPRRLFETAAR